MATARYGLQQQIASFAIKVRSDQANARDVAGWMCERRRQAVRYHVIRKRKNRNRFCRRLRGLYVYTTDGEDRVRRSLDERRGRSGNLIPRHAEPAVQNGKILSFDEPRQAQFVEQYN